MPSPQPGLTSFSGLALSLDSDNLHICEGKITFFFLIYFTKGKHQPWGKCRGFFCCFFFTAPLAEPVDQQHCNFCRTLKSAYPELVPAAQNWPFGCQTSGWNSQDFQKCRRQKSAANKKLQNVRFRNSPCEAWPPHMRITYCVYIYIYLINKDAELR